MREFYLELVAHFRTRTRRPNGMVYSEDSNLILSFGLGQVRAENVVARVFPGLSGLRRTPKLAPSAHSNDIDHGHRHARLKHWRFCARRRI